MKMRLCKWCRAKAKGWDMSVYGMWSLEECEWCGCGMMVSEMEMTDGEVVRLNGGSPEGTMRVLDSRK